MDLQITTQEISCLVRIRPSRGRDKSVGTVHLQVTAQRITHRIPLNILWPVAFFDNVLGILLPRYKGDEEAYSKNIVIQNELSKVNRFRMQLYANGQMMTVSDLKHLLTNYDMREDFVEYFERKRDMRLQDNMITHSTWKAHGTTLSRLKTYLNGKPLPFSSFTPYEVEKFQVWMRKKKNYAHNSVVSSLLCMQCYINLAIEQDNITNKNPFEKVSIGGYVPGKRVALEQEELSKLKRLYQAGKLSPYENKILQRYLISCYTGLRQSDIAVLDPWKHVENGRLRLEMIKTRNYGKQVDFPLSRFAIELIGNGRGEVFPQIESAVLNKVLKTIARHAGVEKYLKFHSGRDTFATQYLRFGGNLADLKDILGHVHISTTEIYLKMAYDSKVDPMNRFDEI